MKRILFVPVSTPHGSGELLRCLIIARELHRADPNVDIHFLVNRGAYFRDSIEFGVHHCDASPTLCTPQVLDVLERLRPNVVVYDNAGRTRQMRTAHRLGMRIVFISRTPRLRRKAFRLRWMRYLSEHWIASPAFIMGGIGLRERLVGRLFPHVTVRFLDALYRPSEPEARAGFLTRWGIDGRPFVLFLPGSGGNHPDAIHAVESFTDAARRFAADTGATALVLTGSNTQTAPEQRDGVMLFPRLHSDEVQHLIHAAMLIVSNGGSSMLHALTQGKPIVAVQLRSDQGRRIRLAAKLGIVAPSSSDPAQIARLAVDLWQDPSARQRMTRCLSPLGLVNGLPTATQALRNLLAGSAPPRA